MDLTKTEIQRRVPKYWKTRTMTWKATLMTMMKGVKIPTTMGMKMSAYIYITHMPTLTKTEQKQLDDSAYRTDISNYSL